MDSLRHLERLSRPDRSRLNAAIDRFESDWEAGQRFGIEAYLPTDEPLRRALLVELVHVELEQRLTAGEPASVEEYLERYSELQPDEPILCDLIRAEFRLRARKDPLINSAEYVARFPHLADRLPQLLQGAALDETVIQSRDSRSITGIGPSDHSTVAATTTGKRVGDFEILEEIARGGMGVVFKARQRSPDRIVALKMILSGQLANDEEIRRFRAEADAAAHLRHPNIVPIYEVGSHDAHQYFSMAYIDGTSLASQVMEGPLPPREAARIVLGVAAAMSYAHEQGVIHRDLKPANVLIDRDGQPHVTDFGLAKKTGADSSLTGTGQILGTPTYMSPEQARGDMKSVGPHSDIYSLGAILYCLLTGRPPFQAATPTETLLQVISQEPVSPQQLNPAVDLDLETICLKCLEKESSRRYATAAALAAELQRFLSGQPIQARPIGSAERVWRWCRRNPVVAGLGAGVAVSLVVGIAVSTVFAVISNQQASKARKSEERATAFLRVAEQQRDRATEAEAEARKSEQQAIAARKQAEDEAERATQVSGFLKNLFSSTDDIGLMPPGFRQPGEKGADVTARTLLLRGAASVGNSLQDQPLVRADLMITLGNVCRSLGLFDKAEEQLRGALEVYASLPDADDIKRAESLFHLGWLLHDIGEYAESQQRYENALAIQREQLPADDLRIALTQFHLAWLLADRDRPLEAEPLFRDALRVRTLKLGESHRDTKIAQFGLFAVLAATEREQEAVRELLTGFDQTILAKAVLNYTLGQEFRRQQRYEQADRHYQMVMELAESHLGDVHPFLLLIKGDRAGLLREMGRVREAEILFREAYDVGRRTLGYHPKLIRPMMDFARELRHKGNYDEAKQIYRDGLEIAEKRIPEKVHERAQYLTSYGQVLHATGELDTAERVFRLALGFGVDQIGAGLTSTINEDLWRILYATGRISDAESLLRQQLQGDQAAGDRPGQVRTLHNLSGLLRDSGRFQEAGLLQEQEAELIRQQLAEPWPLGSADLHGLARQFLALHQIDEAETFFRQAVPPGPGDWSYDGQYRVQVHQTGDTILLVSERGSRTSARLISENEVVVDDWNGLRGTLHDDRIDWSSGPPWRKVTAPLTPNLGLAGCYAELAQFLTESRLQLEEAEEQQRIALRTAEAAVGERHPIVSDYRIGLARILCKRGAFERAEEQLNLALMHLEAMLGPHHPRLVYGQRQMALLLEACGKREQARAMLRTAVDTHTKTVGAQNVWMGDTLQEFAKDFAAFDAREDSRTISEQRWTLCCDRLPNLHPDRVQATRDYAEILIDSGNLPEAEAILKREREQLLTMLPEQSWQIAQLDVLLGRIHVERTERNLAEPLLIRSHDVLSDAFGPEAPAVRYVQTLLKELQERSGNPEQEENRAATAQEPESVPAGPQ